MKMRTELMSRPDQNAAAGKSFPANRQGFCCALSLNRAGIRKIKKL
jgi:hypothetical protein